MNSAQQIIDEWVAAGDTKAIPPLPEGVQWFYATVTFNLKG